jgi:hypothetical protein
VLNIVRNTAECEQNGTQRKTTAEPDNQLPTINREMKKSLNHNRAKLVNTQTTMKTSKMRSGLKRRPAASMHHKNQIVIESAAVSE